jgi:two-component system, OmpR family, sensor kinase
VRIRVRLALLFALATAVLVSVGGYAFVRSLANGLETSLDTSLRTRSATLSQVVRDATGGAAELQAGGSSKLFQSEDELTQILDPTGGVVALSEDAGKRPLVSVSLQRRARSETQFTTVTRGGERFRLEATSVQRSDGRWTVIAGSSLQSADDAVSRVVTALVIAGPIVVVLAGLGAWLLAAGALRPVERMRRRASDISAHDVESRLPVPATRDEIASLATTMNELLERLQTALASERAFVADAGHELRTPLAVLRTELELADRPQRSYEELREAIRNAAVETDRLARVSEQLLFLARGDEDREARARDVEPVMPLLRRSADVFRTRAADRHVTLEVSGDDGIAAPLDPDDVRRAIDNLLDNALRFAPAGSGVRVHARRDAKNVVIEVVDEGPGFSDQFLPHAFDRFRRADDARSRSNGGSGLGLAIVLAVAREHGGTAAARNRPEGGAVVSVHLPADRADGQV